MDIAGTPVFGLDNESERYLTPFAPFVRPQPFRGELLSGSPELHSKRNGKQRPSRLMSQRQR